MANHRDQPSVTLWDRVQTVLRNNPIVVVILLLLISVDGLKTIFETYNTVRETIERHNLRTRTYTSLLPCSRAANMKSRWDVAAEKTSLTFRNSSKHLLAISWIDENGLPSDFKELQPSEWLDVDSYPAHVFILSDPHRGCLNVVVKGTAPSVVERRIDDQVETRLQDIH